MDSKQAKEIQRVSEICAAYELGFMAGTVLMGTEGNEFPVNSDNYFAWIIGHTTGVHSQESEDQPEYH